MPNYLEEFLSQIPQEDYPKESRVHPLPYLQTKQQRFFLKREDELGFFTSGSKIRKWRTLVPSLMASNREAVLLIGSSQSNNVLGLLLLLLEKGIKPLPILLSPHDKTSKGNHLFIHLSLGTVKPIFLKREDWGGVESIAESWKDKMEKKGIKTAIIPEGSYLPEAFFGALTLALDIVRNERECGLFFDHIFLDAGTGLQAIAVILGLALLGHKAQVSVLLLRASHEEFTQAITKWKALLFAQRNFPFSNKNIELRYSTFYPSKKKTFAPLKGKELKNLIHFANNTGVWTDPLYSGRLVLEAKERAEKEQLEGNILLIHTGGLSSLFGFQEKLLQANS